MFARTSVFLLLIGLFFGCQHQNQASKEENEEHSPSHAGDALRMWAMARIFPDGQLHTEKYAEAMAMMNLSAQLRGGNNTWESLGPKNVGGRTLCLAIHPQDTNIMFVGTASGGLWKSTTAGKGYTAWTYIETGFPVLGVSAVAINPANPNEMYIGTGEVYNLENSMPNVAIRVTRGTYGIGILKSTDGGITWAKSLDWTYGDLRGVQDIKINPLRPQTVYAATTEGLFRTYNSGASWQIIHDKRMAVDIELHPTDTNRIFVTHGSLGDEDVSGIYRSTNAGAAFQKLTDGLPNTYSGKTLLSICAATPNVVYASVGNDFTQEGLYKSINGGDSWDLMSTENVASYQGWYSHDVSVSPVNSDDVVWVGIEAFRSNNGGQNWAKRSNWWAWDFGQTPVGGSEGPPNYCHADIHRIYHLPSDPKKVYYATDGGIFVSYDGGNTFEGRNGSLQCTQFYANLGNSTTNGQLCIGGMQDNSTAIYTGTDAWTRVLGGDGECAAIDPTNDQIMYGSSQYLNISKSTNGGLNFFNVAPDDNEACFNGPFEIAPSDPNILYAGGGSLWKSGNGANSWQDISGGIVNDGNGILTIAVCPTNPDLLYFSTAPTVFDVIGVYKSTDGGATITKLENLPNRMCMDIAFHPTDPNTVYAVFGGFGAGHIWKSTNGGTSWQTVDNGLPDLPTNTLLIDPLMPSHVYIGNDLGVWLSEDGGASWEIYSDAAPKGLLVMHLSISPSNRKLRVATYGLGVWQTDMKHVPVKTEEPDLADDFVWGISPNPALDMVQISFDLPQNARLQVRIVDAGGKTVYENALGKMPAGEQSLSLSTETWATGNYGVILEGKWENSGKGFRKTRVLGKIR